MTSSETQSWQQWFQPGRFLLLLGLIVLAGYPDVILGGNTFVTRDFAYFGYPLAYYHKLRFWEGEIPLWNPLNNCGLPFLAQWNTMILYPGSLFYLLLPQSWSLGAFCLLHLVFGGLGTYFLSRKWTQNGFAACIAGMAFATNGLTLNSLMWPNNIAALGWMPWVVLFAERSWSRPSRKLRDAVVIGATQMLTGAPEIILLTWLIILFLAASQILADRSRLWFLSGRLIGCISLIAALALAQLLPFLNLLTASNRDENFFESVWPMPGKGWANLLVPLFQCFSTSQGVYFQPDQYWTTSYYIGCGTLALAIVAGVRCRDRRALVLVVIAFLGLILALGNTGYLYPVLKRTLPVIGFMRFPIKFVVLATFSIPLLASYGTALLLSVGSEQWPGGQRLMRNVAVTLTAIIGVVIVYSYAYPVKQEDWNVTAISGLSRAGFLWAAVTLVLLAPRLMIIRRTLIVGCVLVLLAGFDPMTSIPRRTPTAPRSAYEPNLVQLNPRPQFGRSRVVTSYWAHQSFNKLSIANPLHDFQIKRLGMFADCNLLEGIPKLDGFYSLYLREPDAIWSLFYFQTNNYWIRRAFTPSDEKRFDPLLDFIGASFVSRPQQYFEWTPRTNYMALASAGQLPRFADEITTLRGLVGSDFNPRRHVYLPLNAQRSLPEFKTSQVNAVAECSSQQISVEVSAEQPAILVVAQSYYRPWTANIDGAPAKIWPANLAFQAVSIPAGKHTVHLVYRDWWFIGGLLVSISVSGWLLTRGLRSRFEH